MTIPEVAEYDIADLSRERCVKSTERSFWLSESAPSADAKVEEKSSREKIREVLDVATFDACSITAFAAA